MNNSTREQIFATKERLHQLTQTAENDEQRLQARTRREREHAEEKAREDARYLRQHNKTVTRVLSQAAKADGGHNTSGEEDTEEEDDDESDENGSGREEQKQHREHQSRAQGENRKERGEQPTALTSTGEALNHTTTFSFLSIHTSAHVTTQE